MTAHIYLTDRPLGPYVANLQVSRLEGGDMERVAEVELDLKQLLVHRQHLDNVIDALRDRQFSDAVCGHCEVCSDTRMCQDPEKDRPWSIHCPVCHPKLEAARAVLQTGLTEEP